MTYYVALFSNILREEILILHLTVVSIYLYIIYTKKSSVRFLIPTKKYLIATISGKFELCNSKRFNSKAFNLVHRNVYGPIYGTIPKPSISIISTK